MGEQEVTHKHLLVRLANLEDLFVDKHTSLVRWVAGIFLTAAFGLLTNFLTTQEAIHKVAQTQAVFQTNIGYIQQLLGEIKQEMKENHGKDN